MSTLLNDLEKTKKELNGKILELGKAVASAPEGTLIIEKRRGYTEYYQRLSNSPDTPVRKKYITRENLWLVRALAQKDYDIRLLKVLKARLEKINKISLLNLSDDELYEVYENLAPERKKFVKPAFLTDEQFAEQWLNIPFTPLGFRPEDVNFYYTDRGERVRSKSEVIIANALYHAGIPYKYECPLTINGQTFYPDFTILNMNTREEIYFEHFGMMDDMDYLDKALKKIDFYEYYGLIQSGKVVCTFESKSHPLDTRVLAKVIEKYRKRSA